MDRTDVANERSDVELVRSAGAGDMDALGTLYARHHQEVFELCRRMGMDDGAAEDLTQESFLRVLRYGSGFDGRSTVTSWLYRLVRNRCLDSLAKDRRDHERGIAWAAQVRFDAEEATVQDGRQELVGRALERLPPEMREVLVLSRFGDLRYREIAEVCGISLANVKVRAHRAMKELRRIFKELEQSHDV